MTTVLLPRIHPIDNFLSKFKVGDGCWVWTGSCDNNGYGQFTAERKHYKAYRFSYLLFNGNLPKGLSVLHSCNNPLCVKPTHLYAGTHKQNTQDCIRAGRFKYPPHPKGKDHPRAKLSETDVLNIKTLLANGDKSVSIARKYKVDPSTIGLIKRGVNWKI